MRTGCDAVGGGGDDRHGMEVAVFGAQFRAQSQHLSSHSTTGLSGVREAPNQRSRLLIDVPYGFP